MYKIINKWLLKDFLEIFKVKLVFKKEGRKAIRYDLVSTGMLKYMIENKYFDKAYCFDKKPITEDTYIYLIDIKKDDKHPNVKERTFLRIGEYL